VEKAKEILIILVLTLVIVFNALDIVSDIRSESSYWHIVQESLMILLSTGLIASLLIHLKKQKSALKQLKSELKNTERTLAQTDQRMQLARKEYSKLIHQQLNDWQLSHSEQDIALLLLKGLSFNEIAAVRETKEKTVRQQASEIYRKSGVNGRHAFSAWFFEDFLI
jgi:DNA-binding NarL/FixJ family response regulator